jgi:hypothetical protein
VAPIQNNNRKPFWAILLIIILIFQSISALFGGIELIIDPSGQLLHMPSTSLQGSPFNDFLVPGLCLGILLGIFPAFTAFCLLFRPRQKWVNILNIYKFRHPGWAYSLYTGLMLIIWITVQIAVIGYGHIIQTMYVSIGIIITIITLIPKVMDYYYKTDEPEKKGWRTL